MAIVCDRQELQRSHVPLPCDHGRSLIMPSTHLVYKQFAKYLAVGGLSNGLAYGLYLAMTLMGMTPLWSMTIVYAIAAGLTFIANKSWTFQSDAAIHRSAPRYLISQAAGYTTNLLLLNTLHYTMGVPHYLAQLVGIVVVAIGLFLLNRYYVFN